MATFDGYGAGNEWIETEAADERFLPLIEGDASRICEHLWLGSEENVRDLVWLKVEKITRIVTIMPYPIDPTSSGSVSEALKSWHAENVETLFLEALDTPSQLVRRPFLKLSGGELTGPCAAPGRYSTTCARPATSSRRTWRRSGPSSSTAAAASRGRRRSSSRRS